MLEVIVASAFAIFGAILLATYNGHVNYRVNNRKRRDDAAEKFRQAFAPTLSALKQLRVDEIGQVRDILIDKFSDHETALTEFCVHIGWFERRSLTLRWDAYRGPKPQVPELPSEDFRYRFSHFVGASVEDEEIKRVRAIYEIEQLVA